jgi:hypothetical protein
MRAFRRHKDVLIWVAAIALLSNLFAAVGVGDTGTALADDSLDPIVICTADGAKALSGDGGTGKHGHEHCAACTIQAASAKVAVAFLTAAIAFPALSLPRPEPADTLPLAIQLSLGGLRSRAPPHSA